ncbi:hypothetical protein ASD40_28260 [Paenibacillus sp. Root444D2]|nr:hypothetical protein ASD40_28260 [Paenibacillus sp. Root444D2]
MRFKIKLLYEIYEIQQWQTTLTKGSSIVAQITTWIIVLVVRVHPLPTELLYFVQQFGGFFGQIGFLLYGVQYFGADCSEIIVLRANCCTKYNNDRLLPRKAGVLLYKIQLELSCFSGISITTTQ